MMMLRKLILLAVVALSSGGDSHSTEEVAYISCTCNCVSHVSCHCYRHRWYHIVSYHHCNNLIASCLVLYFIYRL